MKKSPYEIFQMECPKLATKLNEYKFNAQLICLDQKTKQQINITIQTANKNPIGVKMHAMMAKTEGVKRDEVINTVTMHLHISYLSTVLECLPSAIEGYDGK